VIAMTLPEHHLLRLFESGRDGSATDFARRANQFVSDCRPFTLSTGAAVREPSSPKFDFASPFKPIRVTSPASQNFASAFQKCVITSAHPLPIRGTYRDRHGVGSGMRWTRWRHDERRLMRTAKSCGPDLPTLGSNFAVMIRKATVAIKPGHRGERV
jgi:hypothetical protein